MNLKCGHGPQFYCYSAARPVITRSGKNGKKGVNPMKYDTRRCRILHKTQMNRDTFDLWLEAGELAAHAAPGQFVNLLVPGKVLRRPISICQIDPAAGALRIVFQIRGEGTAQLAEIPQGGVLDVLGPLGRGFVLDPTAGHPVFVGGGIGVPPLLAAASRYGEKASVILGFRDKDAVILEEDFRKLGCRVTVTTDDGSYGAKGLVTGPLQELAALGADAVFACGPTPMLRGVAQIAADARIPCQVSLEERMGCGVGACLGCTHHTAHGAKCICKDGPVFEGEEIYA